MPFFGQKSKAVLATCRPELQHICNEAIKIIDFSVLSGIRNEEEQNERFFQGTSTKMWPDSKHNSEAEVALSEAVDLAPWPIDWENIDRFILLAGIILGIALCRGVRIRWGGDWDNDKHMDDQTLMDWGHFELLE